ncbi:VOC family protein [Ciceribacter sp. L1K22]|uniref:VOC family protein n=1 Tax=Ciceribacter sp. L1K22 TaxID=2820275 RepID=UPI001ABE8BAB|nr:VOC family protein [Ciceribacter sp. L1K22]MBO3758781.1 VOC family protein [Ciceribacter sp. L1K22]
MVDGILETALYADDLDAAEAFYGDLLQLERIVRHGDRDVFFRCGAGILLIFNPDQSSKEANKGALPVPPHGAHGPGHMCFRATGPAIDALCERLAEAGVEIEADFRWPNGARSIYFRDPAGNSLECAEAHLWNIKQDTP